MGAIQFLRLGVISKNCDIRIRELTNYSRNFPTVEFISITQNEIEHFFSYPDIHCFLYDLSLPPSLDQRIKRFADFTSVCILLHEKDDEAIERALNFDPLNILDTVLLRKGYLNIILNLLHKNLLTKQRGEKREFISRWEKMQLENKWLKQAIEHSPSSIIITDIDGHIEYVNPKFCEVSGYGKEELVGQNPRIMKSGVHDVEFYQDMWRTLMQGKTWIGEICNKSKSGKLYWEKMVISPLMNERNQPTHFIGLRADDMDRRRAEDAIRRAEALKSMQDLAGSIAHEFSQPLQVLTMSLSLLEDQHGNNPYLERANRMTSRIIDLVSGLKNIIQLKKQDYLNGTILNLKESSSDPSAVHTGSDITGAEAESSLSED